MFRRSLALSLAGLLVGTAPYLPATGSAQPGAAPATAAGLQDDGSGATLRRLDWACNGILVRTEQRLGRRVGDATSGGHPCDAF